MCKKVDSGELSVGWKEPCTKNETKTKDEALYTREIKQIKSNWYINYNLVSQCYALILIY